MSATIRFKMLATTAIALCSAVTLTLTPAAAQTFPTDDPVIQAMWEEGMGDGSQVHPLAQALLDSIGPRLMGTPAYARSADWLVANYERWGIDAERQDYGTWTGWNRGITHIDLLEPRVRSLEGMILAWSPGTDGPVEGEVVMLPSVSSAEEFAAWLPSAEGKFVATSFAEPTCREDQSWQDHATPETFERMTEARNNARLEWFNQMQRWLGRDGTQRLEEAGALGLLTGRWSNGWGVDKIFSSQTPRNPLGPPLLRGLLAGVPAGRARPGPPHPPRRRRRNSWATSPPSTWWRPSRARNSPTNTWF